MSRNIKLNTRTNKMILITINYINIYKKKSTISYILLEINHKMPFISLNSVHMISMRFLLKNIMRII